MSTIKSRDAAERLRQQLGDWLCVGDREIELDFEADGREPRVDFVASTSDRAFLATLRKSNALPSVDSAIQQARKNLDLLERSADDQIALVVVPYMTKTGRERCRDAGVSWADLSGNAHITAPGLFIHVEGKPNQFKRRGRPSNVFASKSSRIARHLLMHPDEWFLQRELTEATGLSEGYTSRIVRRLDEQRLVVRKSEGRSSKVKARDPDLFLDTWRENYDFTRHEIHKGVVAARTGPKLLRKAASTFENRGIEYGATGLAGAWLWEQFASFRTVTFYLNAPLNPNLKEELGVREGSRGANLWLVAPDDEGVLDGTTTVEGIQCVHPIQIYLDLLDHPERSKEAARHLRNNQLNWSSDDA